MKLIPELDTMILRTFWGTFSGENSFIREKNMLWKADEIFSESEIVSRKAAGKTGWKTYKTGRRWEIYQNRETPDGTVRFEMSESWKVGNFVLTEARFLQHWHLTRFRRMFPFYIPWKHQKTKGFLLFSGGIKWKHWLEMG